MAWVVGVLLIVLCLVGAAAELRYLVRRRAPSGLQQLGDDISRYLGVAHGWLYMIFLVMAFLLSRRPRWDAAVHRRPRWCCGTVPVLSFWVEHRATARVRAPSIRPTLVTR